MRVGVIQSCYLPWRGYFDFIADVDLFVIYDDVQYSKGSWRNRNRVKTPRGLIWLTVPVSVHGFPPIDEVEILDSRGKWRLTHEGLLEESFAQSPFAEDALRLWREGTSGPTPLLSQLNRRLISGINEYLGISTPLVDVRKYQLRATKTCRLIDLLTQLGATTYVSGPSADAYLEEEQFRRQGIRLEYKTYDYAPYPQPWGEFQGQVTVLDLIANVGPQARELLRSQSPNRVVGP